MQTYRCPFTLTALLVALSAPPAAHAATIVGTSVVDNSSADTLIDEARRVREFATVSTLGPTVDGASQSSFQHQMAWFSGHRVEPGGPTVALLWSKTVAYDLLFTIDDPSNDGYTLDITSRLRGYATAHWDGNSGSGVSQVFSAGTLMAASLDSGSGLVVVPGLATTTSVATATAAAPDANLLVEREGAFDAGHFIGTRSFTLRFTTVGSNTIAALQNFNTGEAGLRFGLEPNSTRLQGLGYPGADGEAASGHGHFVTVTARFDAVSAVPEPGSALLAGLGLALLGTLGRRAQPRIGRKG